MSLLSRNRRVLAAVGGALLVTATLAVVPASAEPAAIAMNDAPVSGQLVPALRGAAAVKAGSYVSQRFHQQSTAHAQAIPPWSGSLHAAWGVFPNNASNGAQATHTVDPNIHIPSGNPDIIYAPTLDPSGKTCIEVTTYYWQGGNAVGAWDWCAASPGFAAIAGIDTNFINKYTTTVNGKRAYTIQDVQTNATTNSWTAYLFNYTTNAWDALYTSANTSKLTETHGGWDMFEVYTEYNPATGEGYYCGATVGSSWAASNIQIRFGTTWQTLTTSNSQLQNPSTVNPADLGCTNLTFAVPSANSSWRVTH
ncbi:carbohydrate-binding protein [Actinophytocola sp.]|uniref:carbohydrate-binding protein n=1 Tax=Actinophytocola sp. TaxID=1872138 RepID=UPI002D681BAB|nr:carbohydrate-binding protein [Actinophytocola sp.]HYQ63364.1 carbohydrate-binding protein [Actinophytocola sp.]